MSEKRKTKEYKEMKRKWDRKYNAKNKEKIRKQKLEYWHYKYETDINFRLKAILRSRITKLVRGESKNGSALRDLGCSLDELKIHLENQFQDGMSWDNYGEWHIDHIVPLASFDLTDREQFLKACHYTNLQPLWAEDNLKKGARLD
jgi:hypothetical protein